MALLPKTKKLKKQLSLLNVYAIATGTTLSAGFFLLPGLAAAQAGDLAHLHVAGALFRHEMLNFAFERLAAIHLAGEIAADIYFRSRRRRQPIAVVKGGDPVQFVHRNVDAGGQTS